MPSMTPTVSADVPSTATRYTGRSACIISDEKSMNIETKPSAHTPAGMARQPPVLSAGRIATASPLGVVSLILVMSLENLLRINVENPLAGFQTRSSLLGLRPTVEVKFADPVEPTLKPLEIRDRKSTR